MPSPRDLPKVDVLMTSAALATIPEQLRKLAIRATLAQFRDDLLRGRPVGTVETAVVATAQAMLESHLVPVINASGVILHTGLGRARLAEEAALAAHWAASGHSSLEIEMESGQRGDRQTGVRKLLRQLTGAEDAFVVNNCAAAVLLVLQALCSRREVILSRGQMVEIGGSFRLPEIVKGSGCRLVEVGSTNRTRLEDYANAITPRTAAILRCHPSNYQVVGFAEEVPARELATLAQKHRIALIDDAGSGCLVDTARFGLPHEQTLLECVQSGSDVITCSGDKLLGGPQAGIILGSSKLLAKVRRHPVARAVRIDKLCIAALEATLRLYVSGDEDHIPTLKYLSRSLDEVREMAQRLASSYPERIVEEGVTEVGGGSLPGQGVPTVRVGIPSSRPDALAKRFRTAKPPVLVRIERDTVWIDPRTMEELELEIVAGILESMR